MNDNNKPAGTTFPSPTLSEKEPIGTNTTIAVNIGAAKMSSNAIIDRFQLSLKLESIGVTKKVERTIQKLIDNISSRILFLSNIKSLKNLYVLQNLTLPNSLYSFNFVKLKLLKQ